MTKYRLIKLGLAAVMLTSASTASEAADVSGGPAYLPPPSPIPLVYNWTGFYAGAHAGVGWSDDNAGFIGGGQVGFNYQINQWVFGVEGDLAGTTIKDSVSATVAGPGAVITGNAEASLDWVSTLAPRSATPSTIGWSTAKWVGPGRTRADQCCHKWHAISSISPQSGHQLSISLLTSPGLNVTSMTAKSCGCD